jgi:hypothetical protein
MSYTETLLASGERMIRLEHQHWFVLVWRSRFALGGLVLALVLFIVGGALSTDGFPGTIRALLGWLTLGLVLVGLANIVWSYLDYRQEEFVITSRRIIHAEGVINKRATDSSLEKINDAILTQTIVGRIFGFGDLDVLTASETGIERLRMLVDAPGFKKSMLDAKHELELEYTRPVTPPLRTTGGEPPMRPREGAAGSPIAGGPPPGTRDSAPVVAVPVAPAATVPGQAAGAGRASADEVTTALERLAELRDRGVVTEDEFETKKRELLGRL